MIKTNKFLYLLLFTLPFYFSFNSAFHLNQFSYQTNKHNVQISTGLKFINNYVKKSDTENIEIEKYIASSKLVSKDFKTNFRNLMNDAYKNDPGIKEKQQASLDRYYKYSDSLIRRLLAAGIKVILITDPPYDETAITPTPVIHGLNSISRKLALNWEAAGKKYNLPVVNIWSVLNELNKKIQAKDSSATIIGRDRVHVSRLGNFVMSYQFLKTAGVPGTVSAVDINAGKRKLIKATNCTITSLVTERNSVSFNCLEKALPFPTEPGLNPDSLISFTKELNNEIVQVRGLQPGQYQLHIDNIVTGIFSAQELEAGINLANNKNTPQYSQADSVRVLFSSHWTTIADIRAIKFVEYEHLRKFENKDDFNGIKTFLTGKLEEYKAEGNDNYGFFTRMYTKYFENKPREQDLNIKLEQDLDIIRKAAIPRQHTYRIVRSETGL